MDAVHSNAFTSQSHQATSRQAWSRLQVAEHLQSLKLQGGNGLADFARQAEIPRTTMQHWRRREQRLEGQLPPELVHFFRIAERRRIPPSATGRSASGLRPISGRRPP